MPILQRALTNTPELLRNATITNPYNVYVIIN